MIKRHREKQYRGVGNHFRVAALRVKWSEKKEGKEVGEEEERRRQEEGEEKGPVEQMLGCSQEVTPRDHETARAPSLEMLPQAPQWWLPIKLSLLVCFQEDYDLSIYLKGISCRPRKKRKEKKNF